VQNRWVRRSSRSAGGISARFCYAEVLGKTRGIERSLGHVQSVNSSGLSVVGGYINVRCDHAAVSEGTPRVTEHRIELGDLLLDLVSPEGLDSIPGAADETDSRRSVEFHPPTISPERLRVCVSLPRPTNGVTRSRCLRASVGVASQTSCTWATIEISMRPNASELTSTVTRGGSLPSK